MKHRLVDLIDPEISGRLLDNFSDMIGIATAIIGLDGQVLVSSKWQRICTDFHRVNAESVKACIENNTRLINELQQGQKPSFCRCPNGLTNAASPIIIEGEHLANVLIGQFLLKPASKAAFRRQARKYGFDEAAYLEALAQIPVVTESKLPAILGFLTIFTEMLAKMGLDRLHQLEAERALRESEERYRRMIEHSPIPIAVTDQQSNIVYLNNKFSETFGYTVLDCPHMDKWWGLAFPDPVYREQVKAGYSDRYEKATKRSAEIAPHEVRLVCKDGSTRDVDIRFDLIQNQGACFFIDITERKQTEALLRMSHFSFDHASDAIFWVAPDGRFLYVNDSCSRHLGYSKDELLSMKVPDIDPDYPFETWPPLWQELEEKRTETIETRHRHKDGRIIPVEITLDLLEFEGREYLFAFARDITERKAAQEQEKRLMALIENSHDFIGLATLDGRVLYVNAAGRRIAGLAAEEDVTSRTIFDFVSPARVPFMIQTVLPQLREKGHWMHETQIHNRASDKLVDVEIYSFLLYSPAGHPINIATVMRDITDRKQVEAALVQSDSLLRATLASTADGILVVDTAGKITYFNDRFAELWQLPADVLASRDDQQALEAVRQQLKDPEGFFAKVRQLYATPEADSYDTLEFKDGRTFERYSQPQRIDSRPVGRVWSFRDITQRKQAEEALRQSEEQFRKIFEEGPLGMVISAPDLHFIRANEAFCQMMGFSEQELTAMAFKDITHPDDVVKDAEYVLKLAKGEVPVYRTEKRYIRKDKMILWGVLTISAVRDGNGEFLHYLAMVEDITERRKAEQEQRRLEAQVLHAQKLESLGVLAGGIAHDFNNLLMGVLGYADLALMELVPESPARGSIQEIVQAARRATELSKQMLAYSGKGQFIVQPLNLSAVVEEMSHLLQVSISKKVVLRYDFTKDLPSIKADATQVRQIIMNLITNASDAVGEKSGLITIRTGAMFCDQQYLRQTYLNDELPEGIYVYLEVSDTGCGMDAETKAKIFDPFFTTKFTGRGLGLAAVLGIVRGHRGAIMVYSEVGRGSTFKVLFPAIETPAESIAAAKDTSDQWRGSGQVLVIDDEVIVRTLVKQMLEHMGFEVLLAADGVEGVQLFQDHHDVIKLVLLDVTMPQKSGEETFEELCRIRPDIRVILSSGYNETEATSLFTGKGLAGFIQKPYQFENLRNIIRQVFPSFK